MKEKLTCCIIDDEPLAQEILEAYVSKVPFLELKGSFSGPVEATGALQRIRPDVLFLDINMPDLDGLSFIPMLHPRPMVILTTAYDQYALKAFDLEVKDYLLKPISFDRFYRAVMRLSRDVGSRLPPGEAEAENGFIFLKVGHQIRRVATAEILFVEGVKDYLRVHTRDEKILTLMTFAKLEELLSPPAFVRVHRSFLVAIDKIEHIEKNRIRMGEQLIPISESYAEAFYRVIKGG